MDPAQLRSETLRRFDEWGLKPTYALPEVESLEAIVPKTPSRVAERAYALGYVVAVASGAPRDKITQGLAQSIGVNSLTDSERDFLGSPPANERQVAEFTWLVESIQAMAWALGLADLRRFQQCQNDLSAKFPPFGASPETFIKGSSLIPATAMRQEADTLYMLHWRAVENRLTGQNDPRVVLPCVAYRRHALDWVLGVAEDWDDVPMDT